MSKNLSQHLKETLFVFKKGPDFKKNPLPVEWESKFCNSDQELIQVLEKHKSESRQVVFILGENDYELFHEQSRAVLRNFQNPHFGVLVVSDRAEGVFDRYSSFPDLLEVVELKAFKKKPELYLKKVIRHLLRKEDHEIRRLGQRTLERLNQIFIKLSAERNSEVLLSTILTEAIELTSAYAGILYVAEEIDGELVLTFRIQNSGGSTPLKLEKVNYKSSESSVCGYVVLTGKFLNISNVQSLPPHMLPQLQPEVDYGSDGTAESVLTFPLKNSRHEVVGVLQLINKQAGGTVPFEKEDESLLHSLSTQAAICLENVELYGDIQKLFDGFVKASITAIESRDPSTAGHSERVAKMTVALAEATTHCNSGVYRSVKFNTHEVRELEYAALLHDFGKIGVREEVLVKAKKLYPYQLATIRDRLKACKAAIRVQYLEKKLHSRNSAEALEKEYLQAVGKLDRYWEIITQAAEPTVLNKEVAELLNQIRNDDLKFPDGFDIQILTQEELATLSINRGSLTPTERLEVESHVRHTYQFLKLIHWTKDFRHLPDIAHAHHEKLDGSGYPRGLLAHEIPLQSKIMTIADIYDALTASDRWYKDAVPTERALDILSEEVNLGKLDPILFEIFLEQRIYEVVQTSKKHRRTG